MKSHSILIWTLLLISCATDAVSDDTDAGVSPGWCDLDGDVQSDPDCLLDGACEAVTAYTDGETTAQALADCWESGDGGSAQCDSGENVLDPNDPDCSECDFFPEEPRCEG